MWSRAILTCLFLSLSATPAFGQDPPTQAGEVSSLLPQALIERGTAAAVEVNRNDPLFWRDWVETKERGRARLGLNDGSVINVGSQARLQVLEHEQAAETTELLLQAGKARTWIRRQSTPGRKFQVRTNAAVIGFIGTHVYVESTETLTTVINVSGQSSIRSADETITEQVLLDAFEAVDVEPGKPPGPKRKGSRSRGRVAKVGIAIKTMSDTPAPSGARRGNGCGAAGTLSRLWWSVSMWRWAKRARTSSKTTVKPTR